MVFLNRGLLNGRANLLPHLTLDRFVPLLCHNLSSCKQDHFPDYIPVAYGTISVGPNHIALLTLRIQIEI